MGLANAQIVITEINYNGPESGTDTTEFIEFYNNSASSVNMQDWVMADGVTYTFPNVTVAAGAYIVICYDSMAIQNVFGVAAYEWTSGGLTNSGEDIVLHDDNGATIDSVDYDDGGVWPTEPDGFGQSLVLCDPSSDNNDGSNWSASLDSTGVIVNSLEVIASPGAANTCDTATATTSFPYYDISEIHGENANGEADSNGVVCWTSGVVVGIDMDGNNGYSFTIMDTLGGTTNGINIFNFNDVDSYVVTEGDSILVRGEVDQYNGLTELVPDSIVLLNQNNPLPDTVVVTEPTEATESRLIQLNGFWIIDPNDWPSSANSSSNVDMTNGTDTITMRIDGDTDIGDSLAEAPAGPINIIGIGGQFDSSNPYTDGYQVFPRYLTDLDVQYPYYPIADINNVDANGEADSSGVMCLTSGIVTSIDFDGNNGYSFSIQTDEGINVFSFNDVSGYVVDEGDSLLILGEVDFYNGLTEFVPDTIIIMDSNLILPDTQTVNGIGDSVESEIIHIPSVYVADTSQWPNGGSANVDIVTQNNDTLTMRIDSDTDIETLMPSAPAVFFDVYGIGWQFDNSSPYTDGFQIQPRYVTDIDTTIPQPNEPVFNIIGSNQTVNEATAGTYDIVYSLTNANSMAVSVTMVYDTNNSTATNGADVTFTSPVNISLPPNTTDTDTVTITIIDDGLSEQSETARIRLINPTNAALGIFPAITFTIEDDDFTYPFYPIPEINNVDANGEPDSMGVVCWTEGVVLGVDLDGNAGLSFTIWDDEGINVFNFVDVSNYVVTEGDSIRVLGEIDFYNGLTEIFADSIQVLNTGNTLPEVPSVSAPSEETESAPIRIVNVSVIDASQWPTSFSSNVQLLTCHGDTITMRVDTDTDVEENIPSAPTGLFTVTGIGGQFDNDGSNGYLSGYQIFPMYHTDIDTVTDYTAPSLIVNEIMADNSNANTDPNGDNDDWAELKNTGTATVSLAGLYFTDDASEPMKYMVPWSATETIASGGYELVWCDDEDEEGPLHTNFDLAAGGEYFGVTSYDGCDVVDGLTFPALGADESYGYYPEGTSTAVVFPVGSTTPGAMNMLDTTDSNISVGHIDYDNNQLVVYPNPALSSQEVRFNRTISYEVYDIIGNLIIREQNSMRLDVADLESGTYLIKTTDNEILRMVVK